MKRIYWILTALILFAIFAYYQVPDESGHGLVFPASAQNFQNRGDSKLALFDRGIATLVEIDRKDLSQFEEQLKISERRKPTKDQGDPMINGWNVWPQDAKTFVPGNDVYGGFKKTWNAEPVPFEMLSCESPAGDWLHVEIWSMSDTKLLLKLYTDWN